MGILRYWSILFVLLISCPAFAKDIKFKATAPEAVAMGEQFRLTYTVNEEARSRDLRISESIAENFDILMGPSQAINTSQIYINGKSESSIEVTFTYILMPKKEGVFNIGPASLKVSGANYQSNELSIKVLPEDQKSSSSEGKASQNGQIAKDDLFIVMNVSKRNVYEQESLVVSFKLYSRLDCGINDIKFPEFDGFVTQEVELPTEKQWSLENYNGKNYRTILLKQTVLFPQKSGDITIGAAELKMVARVPSQKKARSFFDDFFDTYQDINKIIRTSPTTIHVKPLPGGKPSNFSNAVGNYSLEVELVTEKPKSNESITIKVKLSGEGNLKLAKMPNIEFPADFEIYDPKTDLEVKTTANGMSGSKVSEYYAVPRFPGKFEIEPIQFSYFDTKSKSYKTIKTAPFHLDVAAGASTTSSETPMVNYTNKEQLNYIGKDIRFLKINSPSFFRVDRLFTGSLLYWMCYLIPALLLFLFFIIYRKQVKENADIKLVKTKKANKIATKRLKAANLLLKEQNKELFYEEVLKAMWGYLSDKLSIPTSELTKETAADILGEKNVDQTVIDRVIEVLNTCEFARYAPATESHAMEDIYNEAADLIGILENRIK